MSALFYNDMEALNKYLEILVEAMAADADNLSSRWMYTIVPLMFYLVYAVIKWYILLMPVTLPLTLLCMVCRSAHESADDKR